MDDSPSSDQMSEMELSNESIIEPAMRSVCQKYVQRVLRILIQKLYKIDSLTLLNKSR